VEGEHPAEDSLFMDAAKKQPATNRALVERVATIVRAIGRRVATAPETRRRIGLGDPPRA
jgi:uncharacterized protein (DUF849 family)